MRIRRTKLSARSGSRPAVGSSSSSSSGSSASARASATRLIMPPDSSAGISRAWRGSSSTMSSLSITRSRMVASSKRFSSRNGKAMLSKTVKAENSAPCWNSTPKRRRKARSRVHAATEQRLAEHANLALRSGSSRPIIWRSSVVLPLPEPPTSATISPGGDVEIETAMHPDFAEAGGQVANLDDRRGRWRRHHGTPMLRVTMANTASTRITTVIARHHRGRGIGRQALGVRLARAGRNGRPPGR